MIGRKRESIFLAKGLSVSGTLRCSLISGMKGIGKTTLLEHVSAGLLSNGSHILIPANGRECSNPGELLSQFTRNLFSSHNLDISDELKTFARHMGKSLMGQIHEEKSTGSEGESEVSDAGIFIGELDNLFAATKQDPNFLTPVVVIDDIDFLSAKCLRWLSNEFNEALRRSVWFKTCRFLFTSSNRSNDYVEFWTQFGIENPVDLKLPPFTIDELEELGLAQGYKDVVYHDLSEVSGGNPAIALQYLQNGFIMNNKKQNMDVPQEDSPVDLSKFSEKELEYLLYASYPSKVNRHNLEHFCSPKLAAFSYNWLKRQNDLCENLANGDFTIGSSVREQMRKFHLSEEPVKAEEMATLASVLDAFYDLFPDIENHWIPINLQCLNSFSKSLCRKVFNEFECESIFHILDSHEQVFEKRGRYFSVTDEVCQLIQRYMELTGLNIKDGLLDSIRAAWDNDQTEMQARKNKISVEENNLKSEIEEIQSQVTHFQDLKNGIEENFKSPKRSKSKRVVTFNMSIALVVFGLFIVGTSLMSDMFGTYHAACGLAVTIFGFFWPNVEIKNINPDGTATTSNLAVETQQRSLEHRISGLLSRANSIALNLENLATESKELEQSSIEPYVSDS